MYFLAANIDKMYYILFILMLLAVFSAVLALLINELRKPRKGGE